MTRPACGLWRRAMLTSGVCLLILIGTYVLAVWTPQGQRFEDAVLAAAGGPERLRATSVLEDVSAPLLGAAVIAIVTLVAARRRIVLGAAAAAVVVASVLTTEVLQRTVLRPILLEAGRRREDQSFPSGHTAVAVSVMCALVMVAPHRLRAGVAFLAALLATSVGVATVTAGWHRPSDTIGSDLVAAIYACLAIAALARRGRVSEVAPRRGRLTDRLPARRYGPVVFIILGVAGGLGGAVVGLADGNGSGAADSGVPAAGRALALFGSTAVCLTLLALLRGVDLAPPARATRPGQEPNRRHGLTST